jgi:hypothetical protein
MGIGASMTPLRNSFKPRQACGDARSSGEMTIPQVGETFTGEWSRSPNVSRATH